MISLILCIATGQLALPASLIGWGLSALFAILVTVGAVVLFQLGTFIIGGQQSSILSALEPITSVVVGIVIFNEVLTFRTAIGVVLVIAATVLIAVTNLLQMKKQ